MNDLIIKSERLILRSKTEMDIDKVHVLHSLAEIDKYNTLGILENIEEYIQRFTFATGSFFLSILDFKNKLLTFGVSNVKRNYAVIIWK